MKKIKFNLIDYLIVFITLVFILYFWSLKTRINGKSVANKRETMVTFKVLMQEQDLGVFKPLTLGSTAKLSLRGKEKIIIKNIEILASKRQVFNKYEKNFIMSKVPNKFDLILTLESNGFESEENINVGENKILVDKYVIIRGHGYSLCTKIIDVKCESENKENL